MLRSDTTGRAGTPSLIYISHRSVIKNWVHLAHDAVKTNTIFYNSGISLLRMVKRNVLSSQGSIILLKVCPLDGAVHNAGHHMVLYFLYRGVFINKENILQ